MAVMQSLSVQSGHKKSENALRYRIWIRAAWQNWYHPTAGSRAPDHKQRYRKEWKEIMLVMRSCRFDANLNEKTR